MSYFKGLLIPGLLVIAVSSCVPAGPSPLGGPEPQAKPVVEDEMIADELTEPAAAAAAAAPVVLGVIVSQSGDPFLERFGGQVLDGIRLAVDAYNRVADAPVELTVLDDEGDPDRAAELLAELEAQGVVAVVGPLRPEGVAAAAAARQDSLLLLLSPTSPDLPHGGHLYSLNTFDTRGAEVMAEYALANGLHRVGLLYAETPEYRRQANAFRDLLIRGGGTVVAEAPYPPETNTFAEPLQAIASAEPDAVYIPASERDVRQIAPQIVYYGLAETGTQILGGEGWSGDEVLHEVAARYLEGIVATTALYRPSPEFGWTEFVSLYEEAYRRSLDNALPALGYDAAKLVLRALGEGHRTPAEVVRRFEEPDELRGATGWISIRAGKIERRPILVRIEDGKLVPLLAGTGAEIEH